MLAFGVLFAVEVVAGWTTHGPEGFYASGVAAAAAPSRGVFAVGAESGGTSAIYRSDDGGSSWERIDAPPFGENYIEIATDPNDPDRVFAATSRAGFPWFWVRLFGSDDGGETWTLRQSHDFATYPSMEIAFDPVEPDTIFTAYYDIEAIYRSDDGGESFTGFPAPFGRAILAAAPDGGLVAASEFAVWVSRDRAESWTRVADPPIGCPASAVAVDPVSGRWWIGTWEPHLGCGEVIWTDDGGATWTHAAAFGAPVVDLLVDPAGGALYVSIRNAPSGGGRVMRTTDGGSTWSDLRIPVTDGPVAIAVTPDGRRLYAAMPEGVFTRDLRRPRSSPPPR